MTIKTRKQGNSLIITVPAEFKIGENVEFNPMLDDNGVISFVPVHKNLFAQHPEYDLKNAIKKINIGDNGSAVGKENIL
ncbi:type II toxin-antitoxin system PemI/MazE family antitoxin [Companilactobacillus kedongensis]|uniref:type II toxin-antitoxin system PemI/MazE family antitoxin n=1 Tax=Companilactobacillus kedongensis TaxID=2486004 RepID=UPI000F7B0478|nr:AbrB family transcriptional regulator [Companilactobacillus kedongensis]